MKRASVAVILATIAACRRSPPPPEATMTDAPASSPPIASASVPIVAEQLPRQRVFEGSVADFRKDVLDECVDAKFVYDLPEGTDAGWMPKVGDPVAAMWKSQPTVTRIPRSCSVQFPGRVVLATCSVGPVSVTADSGVHSTSTFVSRYYNFETVGTTDTFMKQCFESGGTWDALAQDSDQYVEAKRKYDLAKLHGRMDRLQKQIDDTR